MGLTRRISLGLASLDSQLSHLRLQRRSFHADAGRRSGRASDQPVGLPQHRDDLLTLRFFVVELRDLDLVPTRVAVSIKSATGTREPNRSV